MPRGSQFPSRRNKDTFRGIGLGQLGFGRDYFRPPFIPGKHHSPCSQNTTAPLPLLPSVGPPIPGVPLRTLHRRPETRRRGSDWKWGLGVSHSRHIPPRGAPVPGSTRDSRRRRPARLFPPLLRVGGMVRHRCVTRVRPGLGTPLQTGRSRLSGNKLGYPVVPSAPPAPSSDPSRRRGGSHHRPGHLLFLGLLRRPKSFLF